VLRQRTLSVAVFVPPLLIVLALGEPWFGALIAAFVVVGAWEAMRLLRQAGYAVVPAVGILGALAVATSVAALPGWGSYDALLVAAVVAVAGIAAFVERDTTVGLAAWMATVFGAVYVGQLGALVRIGQVAPPLPSAAPAFQLGAERGWILLVILLVWSFDTGAYFLGTAVGKRKFLSHISPSKSYWGVFGGVVAATVVALAGMWALGQPPLVGLLLGPAVGVAAQAGDLAESMLKRAAGAKDSSGLIPGHGGILDRTDAFIFAAPVVAAYVAAFVR
jgi:phosphatidate cytidylyltransferase